MKRNLPKKTRLITLVLTSMVTVAVLGGCSGSGGAEESDTASASNAPQDANAAPAEQPVQTEPLKIVRRSLGTRENGTDNQKVLDIIEQQSGIKLEAEVIPRDVYPDKINLLLASGEKFDFIEGQLVSWTALKDKGSLMPLNDLIDQYGPNIQKYMKDALEVMKDKDGVIWGIPRQESFPTGYAPTIRKDWLDALGMEMPHTMAEFEAYMDAVKKTDLNKNGKHDEIPLLHSWNLNGLIQIFQPYFMGDESTRYLKGDEVIPAVSAPGYKEMLTTFRNWYAKGYILKDFATINTNQITDLVLADRVGAYSGWFNSMVGNQIKLNEKNPNVAYDPLPPLEDAPATGTPAWGSNPKYSSTLLIPSTSKNAAFLIKYLDWTLASPDNVMLTWNGIEGENWEWVDKSKNTFTLLENASERYAGYYNLADFFDPAIWPTYVPADYDKPGKIEYRMRDIYKDYKFVEPFDAAIPFTLTGTPAENLTGDGATKIAESQIQYIIGAIDEAGWDKAVEDYMKIEGDILTEVWTKQYQEFKGIK
ncbi:type 2 periplasmic-binding domain-containing protein [Paenibacillus glycinis]|uniref:Extracellular solute-binding protein n=1 Tax=Paenibacillus glycinis TaxID=2697035 RepID=A0ABW9XKH0_9BACL|nr:hypothetical protein [Paenibacillus glycinis]NBD22964.1 hypothetical protein [Paenibacillus glycinis]